MKLRFAIAMLMGAATASASAQTADNPRAGERFKSVRVLTEIPARQIIPTMAFMWNKSPAAASSPLPDPNGVIDRYLNAVGANQFEKLTSQGATGTVTRNSGRTAPVGDAFELYQERPSTLRLTTKLSHPPEADVELSMAFLKPSLLKGAYTTFTSPRRDRIGDHGVTVLTAESRRGGIHMLYFDDDSGLLIRRTDEIETPLGRVPQRYDFERYRTVDGFAVPGIIRWSRADYQVTFELTEIRHEVRSR